MTTNTNLHPLAVLGPATDYGGSLAGYCRTTYAILCSLLGEPHFLSSADDKVNVEWAFRCADGTTFHVYDWKLPAVPTADYHWHIGGNSAQSLKAFSRYTGLPITRNP